MTSELSNALNPNIAQSRSRLRNHAVYPAPVFEQPPQPPPQFAAQYAPHRSELERAITEPSYHRPLLPSAPAPAPVPALAPAPPPDNTLEQILRVLSESKADAEKERERRIAWEKEQEARYASKQSEMDEQLHKMREELALLKSTISVPSHAPTPPAYAVPHFQPSHFTGYPHPGASIIVNPPHPPTPLTPVSQHAVPMQPQFVEGSSSQPYGPQTPSTPQSSVFLTPQLSHIPSVANTPSPMLMPTPSPVAGPSQPHRSVTPNSRKRNTPPSPDGNQISDDSEGDDEADPGDQLPRKRLNGHDKRCLTIQHAMRVHFCKAMKIQSDKELPESHIEGAPLPDTSPIRFVWEKTSKQSVHNSAMKKRFLADLKAKQKRWYKYVPEKDFNAKTLDSAYEQAYTTLRQKYKTQRDETLARNMRMKEDHKALKARRNVRKRTKLNARTDARKRNGAFAHATFDGALQPECMSSEESCDEYSDAPHPSGADVSVPVVRMRGLPWRSVRLTRFYAHLDEDEKVDKTLKSKRPQARTKERCLGPPKDGFHLPPKGVASWMISQRWFREARDAHPDLGEILKGLVVDPPGFDWDQFHFLGPDSEDEFENRGHEEIPRSEISYSLAHALAPM